MAKQDFAVSDSKVVRLVLSVRWPRGPAHGYSRYSIMSMILFINAKNFHGSLTTVVRAQNDTPKTANITCTIFDRTLV